MSAIDAPHLKCFCAMGAVHRDDVGHVSQDDIDALFP